MGIFYESVQIVNRTSEKRTVIFDGQRISLQPNYTKAGERIAGVVNMLPKIAVQFALEQNQQMETEDPEDPGTYISLVGVDDPKGGKWWHDCSFLEPNDGITPVKVLDYLNDPTAKIEVRGKKIPKASDARQGIRQAPFELPG